MRIIFGWSEFKIKKYTSVEIGIKESVLPKTEIQLIQKYFHLFFIPFFSTGKIWNYNSNGYWLKLHPEQEAHIAPEYKHQFAPWYAFSGILLLLLIGISFSIYDMTNKISQHNSDERDLEITKDKLTKQINHLNEHFYIGLENRSDGITVSTLFLKIEKIKNQKIICSIIEPINTYEPAPLYIDSLYNNSKDNFDTISITKQTLLKSIPLKNNEKYNTPISGILIKGKNYSITDVKEHDKPLLIIGNRRSRDTEGNFMFSFINQLDSGTLIGIENDKSTKLNWKITFPFAIPAGCMTNDLNDLKSIFELYGTGYKANQPFQFVLKCIDKKNKKINFLVKGNDSEYTIEEIY